MLIRAVLILTILSSPALAASDPWGNVYPAQCTSEATDAIKTPAILVNNLPVKKGTDSRCGFYDERFGLIYILKSCSHPRSEVLRHERCHVIAGHWHQ